jgi:hypothetical protein
MFLEVVNAEYLQGYVVRITFNTGEVKQVDFEDCLKGPVFGILKDLNVFRSFRIHFNTIEWPNGADFAPEYLFKIGKSTTQGK